ncbi:MAG: hypothetical protein SGJ04_10740 [Bacteroidota bacterium]|nr:hypothetical protein [Bacteroidota bacterium]
MIIDEPNVEQVKLANVAFNADDRNNANQKTVILLVNDYPTNTKIEDIYIKVVAINEMYDTAIADTYTMAKHILELNIDSDVQAGNIELVDKIAKEHGIIGKKTGKEVNFYSFATKYCHFHNVASFPIFDNNVRLLLLYFNKRKEFGTFRDEDLRKYKDFKRIYTYFISKFELTTLSLTEIDTYMRVAGKGKLAG